MTATRRIAFRQISDLLIELARPGRATLVGFDFPYGYPHGFAQALGLDHTHPWKQTWDLLVSRVGDDDRNRSNRFHVAADLNASISDEPFPFWGSPSGQQQPLLTSKRGMSHRENGMAEFRYTDRRARGAQPVWKLCYPGSVGSQALVGIPYVANLGFHSELADVARVWPFETGFRLAGRNKRDWVILHAEIYPSLNVSAPAQGECKDQAQVRCLAEYFAGKDVNGSVGDLFVAPGDVSQEHLALIEAEEGWLLGVV